MKYVGSRYVPKFMGTYDATQIYEALCVVDNGMGTSYISQKIVPAGTPLTDTSYWAVYGASSGAIINLQQQIDALKPLTSVYESCINVLDPDESTGLDPVTGDGVTDDTVNLNAIMQYALVHDLNVFFPKGTYKISSIQIQFTSSHKTLCLYGVGKESDILVTGNGIIFLNVDEYSIPNYCRVENLRFTGASGISTWLLQFVNVYNGYIANCLFEYAYIGLKMVSNIWGNIINCRFQGCTYDNVQMVGVDEDPRGLYAGNNAINFIGCVSQNAGHSGFDCFGNSGCNFYGCTAEANEVCGIQLQKSGPFNGRGNLISGCWFEFNKSGHVYIDGTYAATDCNETVSDSGFVIDDTMIAHAIVIVSNNAAVLVSGCHFRRISGTYLAYNDNINLRSIHNRFSYTPTFIETNSEHSDTPHCRVYYDGTILHKTRDIVSVSKTATGTYDVKISHHIYSASVLAEGNGMIGSANIINNADDTCDITVVTRNLSTLTDTDNNFTLIAM